MTHRGFPLASRWSRLGAHLLDMVIYLAAMIVVLIPVMLVAGVLDDESDDVPLWTQAVAWAGVIGMWCIQSYFVAARGQTFGKMAARTRIVDHRTAANPGFARAVLMRGLLPFVINSACGLFGLVDTCFIFGPEKRCVHDHMAGTIVVPADFVPGVDPAVFD